MHFWGVFLLNFIVLPLQTQPEFLSGPMLFQKQSKAQAELYSNIHARKKYEWIRESNCNSGQNLEMQTTEEVN